MTFEQRTEGSEGKSHISAKREERGKVLRQEDAWYILRTSGRPERPRKREQGGN